MILLDTRRFARVGKIAVFGAFGVYITLISPIYGEEDYRTWTTRTGKFQVEAQILSATESTVTLKKKDGGEVALELKKLSEADRRFIQEWKAAHNPFENEPDDNNRNSKELLDANSDSAVEADAAKLQTEKQKKTKKANGDKNAAADWAFPFQLWGAEKVNAKEVIFFKTGAPWKAPTALLEASSAPSQETINENRLPLSVERLDVFDEFSGFIVNPATDIGVTGSYHEDRDVRFGGRQARTNLVATETDDDADADEPKGRFTRIVVWDLSRGILLGAGKSPVKRKPLAVSDDGRTVILANDELGFDNKDVLEIWYRSNEKLRKARDWKPYESDERRGIKVVWAAFAGPSQLFTLGENGRLLLWDLQTGRPEYALTMDNSAPAFSPNRKYLFFLSSQKIGILDVARGKIIAVKPFEQDLTAKISVSAGGKRFAVASNRHFTIYDSISGESIGCIPLDFTIPETEWIDDRFALSGHTTLLDADNGIAVWKYSGIDAAIAHRGIVWILKKELQESQDLIIPVILPHHVAIAAIEDALKVTKFYVLEPGTKVRLNLDCLPDPEKREEIRKYLAAQLSEKEMQVDPQGTIDLVASIELDDPKELSYRSIGTERVASEGKYTFQGNICRLQFLYQGRTAWSITSRRRFPGTSTISANETLQETMKKMTEINYNFFLEAALPEKLACPGPNGPTLGESAVSLQGFSETETPRKKNSGKMNL